MSPARGLAIGLALVASLTGCGELLQRLLQPDGSFADSPTQAVPDYDDPAFWTAHPAQPGPAQATPPGVEAIPPARAPAAVFYVHPTSYLGPAWNGPVDDPQLNARTDELSTKIQASAFNGCCSVHGPRYRQANGQAFVTPSADADAAIDLAYRDVRDAFRVFVRDQLGDRPLLLAAHSQGSFLAARLLREEIAGAPLQARLVAAYLIGGAINEGDTPGIERCDAPEQTGCLVGWNARGPRFPGSLFDFHRPGRRLCVNPLRWRDHEERAPATANLGAVFLHAEDGSPHPGYVDAECRDGLLVVTTPFDPPRDIPSRILDYVVGPENYHPIEFQLFYLNLRENAQARVEAFLGSASVDAEAP